jgi:putative peptidoglycan lipid II flippase
MSVAAAELPGMSSTVGAEEEVYASMRKRMERGLRQIAFFVVPTVVAFLFIGDVLIAALYQGGRFGREDTILVWYILIGSTIGLLAVTLGRLYSSAFYALRDTRTPLRYAMLRVALTGGLGYVFAIPLRPFLIELLERFSIPIPHVGGSTNALGGIALTATAGLAGWIEFALLRRALQKRVGAILFPMGFQIRLWTAAIVAGVPAAFLAFFIRPRITALPLPNITLALIVSSIFGLIYLSVATLLGVPEVKGLMARLRR